MKKIDIVLLACSFFICSACIGNNKKESVASETVADWQIESNETSSELNTETALYETVLSDTAGEIDLNDKEELYLKMQDCWRNTSSYPMTDEEIRHCNLSLSETVIILNPPEDVLNSLSTEKLTTLLYEYPCLYLVTSYDLSAIDGFWAFFQNCAIYNELMSRDNGIECILEYYRHSLFDPKQYSTEHDWICKENKDLSAEVFGCQFVNANKNAFGEKELELCEIIIQEKKLIYEDINNDFIKQYLSFGDIEGF